MQTITYISITIILLIFNTISFEVNCQTKLNKEGNKTSFPDSLYVQYNHESFFNLKIVDQQIDIYNPDYGLLNAAIFYATNIQREKYKKKAFEFLPPARDAANLHSKDMVDFNFFDHTNRKVRDHKTFIKRLELFGVTTNNYSSIGENIAICFILDYNAKSLYDYKKNDTTYTFFYTKSNGKMGETILPHTYKSFALALVEQWMNSTEHKKNILSKDYYYLGCGVYFDYNTINTNKIPKAKATQNFAGKKL